MRPPALTHASAAIFLGDCLDVLAEMPENSVDSIVTDPPYGLGFMGKAWDDLPPGLDWAKECLRVLKPGGHLLAFGGSRTWHRLAVAIEDAGFEMRDSIAWLYGSGFPKSMDVSKAIDKIRDDRNEIESARRYLDAARTAAGITKRAIAEAFGVDSRMVLKWMGANPDPQAHCPTWEQWAKLRDLLGFDDEMDAEVWRLNGRKGKPGEAFQSREIVGQSAHKSGIANGTAGHHTVGGTIAEHYDITAPATPAAQQWSGWGTALKPAFEPIVVARKPLSGTVAANVLEHGTGALNIDGCRVAHSEPTGATAARASNGTQVYGDYANKAIGAVVNTQASPDGRWPTNVVLDGGAADELDEQSGTLKARGNVAPTKRTTAIWGSTGPSEGPTDAGDSGGASRFFPVFRYQAKAPTKERPKVDGIAHPTVKPLALMRWLVRLVTPAGGTVLDTFAGSGATIEAAVQEGFYAMGIEREEDYLQLIQVRLDRATTEETP